VIESIENVSYSLCGKFHLRVWVRTVREGDGCVFADSEHGPEHRAKAVGETENKDTSLSALIDTWIRV
jgi:hypothetical protein